MLDFVKMGKEVNDMFRKFKIMSIVISVCFFLVPFLLKGEEQKVGDGIPYKKVATIQVERPRGLCFDGRVLWLVERYEPQLLSIDPNSGKILKRVPAPTSWPIGIACDGKYLWVVDGERETIVKFEATQQVVEKELPSPVSKPMGIGWDGVALWVSNGEEIIKVSPQDGTTIKRFFTPPYERGGRRTEEIGVTWDGVALWVSDRNTDKIYRVYPETGDVIDILQAPSKFPVGIAFIKDKLYVMEQSDNTLYYLDMKELPQVIKVEPIERSVVYTHEVENYGPGEVIDGKIYIAVPKDYISQEIIGGPQFEPAPEKILTDRWGQKVAIFDFSGLRGGQKFRARMKVKARLWNVRFHIRPEKIGAQLNVPKEYMVYLKDEDKLDYKNKIIQEGIKEAIGVEKNIYWKIRKLTKYIQQRLHYELSGGWDVAPMVLERGSGSCSEYTLLSLSMFRGVGIPARYVGSIVVREDDTSTDEVFHRWTEVYIPGIGFVPWDIQAGDKDSFEKQALPLGELSNRFLITTVGGGNSEYLEWTYNSNVRYRCKQSCLIKEKSYADWSKE